MAVIDRLSALHWKYSGDLPEMDFWTWLACNSIIPNTEALIQFEAEVKAEPELYFTEEELRQTGHRG